METIKVAIDSLKPDPSNARKHSAKNLRAIKSSLQKFGQVEPLLVHKSTRVVIAGNGRMEAMKALGWTEAVISELDITQKEATALAVALNRSSELGEWDRDVVGPLLASLHADGFNLEEIGFSIDDVQTLFDIDLNLDDAMLAHETEAPPAKVDTTLDEDEKLVAASEKVEAKVKFSEYLDESNNYVVLFFKNEIDWLAAKEHFGIERVTARRRDGVRPWSIGVGRVIDGAKYLRGVKDGL